MFRLLFGFLNAVFLILAMCTFGYAQTNEQITLTTYYPSPQGSYVELRTKRLALGDNYISPVAYCWAPAACGNVIDATVDLVVEGKVAIGTAVLTPSPTQRALEVRGNVLFSGIQDGMNTMSILYSDIDVDGGPDGFFGFRHINNGANVIAFGHEDSVTFRPWSLLMDTFNNRVGIGRYLNGDRPQTLLHVKTEVGWGEIMTESLDNVRGADIHFLCSGAGGSQEFSTGVGGNSNLIVPNKFFITDETAGIIRLVIDPAGNVGIGTTTPDYTLRVEGSAANQTGIWANISDARLKKDIRPLENSLETILKLQGVSFKWINPGKGQADGLQRGFIAQDVEKVIPEWVKTGADGYKMLEKVGVEALLVEAIKEQQEEIKNLKAEVAAMKAKINPGN